MSNWATVGDLVFIIGNNEEIIPAKIIKEITKTPMKNTMLYFEAIEDDKIIPSDKLRCTLSEVGYAKGFVFKRKENALDYLKVKNGEGKVNMSSIINRKARRNQEKLSAKSGFQHIDVEKIKMQAAELAVERTQKTIIAALLIAMKEVLNVGPTRAERVLNKMNELIDNKTPEEIIKTVNDVLKIEM